MGGFAKLDKRVKKTHVKTEEITDLVLERLKSIDIQDLDSLELDVLKKLLNRMINRLTSTNFDQKNTASFKRWGLRIFRIGVPDFLILSIYTSIKESLEKTNHKKYMDNLDRAFKQIFKPYISDYLYKEQDTASIMNASLDLIKTLEEAKKTHLIYIKNFLEAIAEDKEFNLPISAEECKFSAYMEKLNILTNESVYLDIIRYHQDFHKAINYALNVQNKSFDEYFLSVKEVDRISTKLLDMLNSLLIKLLSKITVYDPLTQLFNRNYLCYTLNKELHRSKRYRSDISLMLLDIDNFKLINDRYGHTVGDEVLKHVASVIKRSIRATDIPIRYGGEEFIVILPHTDIKSARNVAERIRLSIKENPIKAGDISIHVTVSVGVAKADNFDDHMDNIDKVDKAMYIAKRTGKDRVFVLDDG